MTDWVLLARLVRPQGRKGEIIAEIFTDFPDRFAAQPRVFLSDPTGKRMQAPREAHIERHWLHQGRIVFKFQGIDSMNDAEAMRGLEVVVPPEERVPLEEGAVYIGDLVGCRVIDVATEPESDVGEILDVERGLGGAPDLLVVRPVVLKLPLPEVTQPDAGRSRRGTRAKKVPELLIPFARMYVVSINTAGKRVVMRLPAGLTELNAAGDESGTEDDEG
jgi:16S rRNA processing protein RimM